MMSRQTWKKIHTVEEILEQQDNSFKMDEFSDQNCGFWKPGIRLRLNINLVINQDCSPPFLYLMKSFHFSLLVDNPLCSRQFREPFQE